MQDENFHLRLGTAIRTSRMATGWSQERFADAISMHRAYYSAIERGEKNITLGTLVRLAKGLGVKPSELLTAAGL
ncbi:helix-turn-helix domain-containing protein [Stenotrophomonas maltophilia]|uniref:helix-turn-helix domain-containing protein n=1 Tax=Stenotrophomonas maltophilia TaxID=40324 RepID=UPI0029895B0C|nr:helix-turn-helix transcriptional regulator [Stenotrophomonas maltophilia]